MYDETIASKRLVGYPTPMTSTPLPGIYAKFLPTTSPIGGTIVLTVIGMAVVV